MKLLLVSFEDPVDITPLPKGTPVVVSDGATSLSGEVMASVDILEPPGLEGDYHIEPIVTARSRNPLKALVKAVLRK